MPHHNSYHAIEPSPPRHTEDDRIFFSARAVLLTYADAAQRVTFGDTDEKWGCPDSLLHREWLDQNRKILQGKKSEHTATNFPTNRHDLFRRMGRRRFQSAHSSLQFLMQPLPCLDDHPSRSTSLWPFLPHTLVRMHCPLQVQARRLRLPLPPPAAWLRSIMQAALCTWGCRSQVCV